MTVTMSGSTADLTDEEISRRTRDLLREAEQVSLNLRLQTERLAAALAQFDSTVLGPRQGRVSEDVDEYRTDRTD